MPNKAFVRYIKCGNIVPGSLILTNGTYPEPDAGWIEVPIKMPCGSIKVVQTAQAGDGYEICLQGFALNYGLYSVMSGSVYDQTIAGTVYQLNNAFGWLGKWSSNGLELTLLLRPDVARKFLEGLGLTEVQEDWNLSFFCGG